MSKESVDVLIEGGKATAAPPLGPALGPLGVNIGKVVAEINKKTAEFKGMQVPVKVTVDKDTKEFTIAIGTPPASSLIIKEAKIEKGSGMPNVDKVADLKIEQIIKIAKMKEDNLLGKDLKSKIKEIIGSCDSMGVLVEGVDAREAIELVNQGKFDKEIKEEKTEISAEEMKELEEEKKKLAEEMKVRKSEFEAKIQIILKEMEGKTRSAIKHKMEEAGIPEPMILASLPAETKAVPAAAPKAAAPAKKK